MPHRAGKGAVRPKRAVEAHMQPGGLAEPEQGEEVLEIVKIKRPCHRCLIVER